MKAEKPLPSFHIVGPTVDDDVRRLIRHYGPKEVQAALERQTARRRGPIPKKDWPQLRGILLEDARTWLEGGDPFKTRSNRKIAQDFASEYPGHSYEATFRRIQRKLAGRRRYYTLVEAVWLSEAQHPHADHLRAIRELIQIGKQQRDQWEKLLDINESTLADYSTKFGEPPAGMTMEELGRAAAAPIIPTPTSGAGNVLQILLGIRVACRVYGRLRTRA